MVSLTRRAAENIRQKKDNSRYIRLKVIVEDDNKVDYAIDFTDSVNNDDILYMSYGIKILVGSSTRRYFEDLKVDYTGSNGKGNGSYKYNSTGIMTSDY